MSRISRIRLLRIIPTDQCCKWLHCHSPGDWGCSWPDCARPPCRGSWCCSSRCSPRPSRARHRAATLCPAGYNCQRVCATQHSQSTGWVILASVHHHLSQSVKFYQFYFSGKLAFTLEKLLQRNRATDFCSSTVRFSKSFGYFMRCLSFLSIWRKLQKSFLSAPAAKSLTSFARMSELRDLFELTVINN